MTTAVVKSLVANSTATLDCNRLVRSAPEALVSRGCLIQVIEKSVLLSST